ncbi:MAG: DUF11 domain-containing protein, partial [Kiritimatiellae bacterium]|nr:DUF11 domain-containing protein [Kiritimatiellia bacterium]
MKKVTLYSSLCLAVGWLWSIPAPVQAQTFTNIYTSAGTTNFVVPSGVTQIIVRAWGGGGGSHDSSFNAERPGAGGGAYASSSFAVTSGNSYTIVVGAGGASGNPGQNGGASYVSFSGTTNVLAAGGGGTPDTNTQGPGGSAAASIGTTTFSGGSGGARGTDAGGGGGGSAFTNANGNNGADGSGTTGGAGGTGTGNGGNGGNNGQVGSDGNAPGGGGGGRGNAGVTSGDGAAGRVVIVYTQGVAGPPSALAFSSTPQSVIISNVSALMTVQLRDTNNLTATATNNVIVNLSSSLSGTFRNVGDTANIITVVISNGLTSASFRYIPTVLGSHLLTATASGLTSATQTLTAVDQPTIVQTYFVPFSEENVQTGLDSINPAPVGTNVALISISAFASNTLIYWDHWEDGYESDLSSPTQSTTEIWGDANIANGCPPNFTNPVICTATGDVIARGQAVVSIETMPVPRNPANIFFDGRDRIGVTRPVAVTRFGWDVGPATLLAGAVEVYDTSAHGQKFQIPVGTNIVTEGSAYEYVLVSVMPTRSNATIVVDYDNNGTPDFTTNVAVGATLALTNRVVAGTVVTSSAPVQVTLITGDVGSNYESRWYNIPPEESWSSQYLNPVSSVDSPSGYGRADVVLYNPNTNTLTVYRQYKTAAEDIITTSNNLAPGTFTIVSNTVLNTAQYYYTTNGEPFFGVGFVDATNSGQASDWGFSLVPEGFLTPLLLVGSAPGRDPFSATSPDTNVSPIWVTAGSPDTTVLYVDFNGDGGVFTNDCGEYDTTFDLAYLDSIRIYDPDGDQTAMKLFTCDGTLITAAWGQDPEIAPGAQPSLDMGYTVLPLPSIQADKEVDFAPDGDLNIDSVLNPGEIIRYTIIVTNPNDSVSGGVTVQDILPAEVTYSNNSTFLDGSIPIGDSGSTAFPLDEGGYFLGVVTSHTARVITFDAVVINPYTSDNTVITNRARVFDDVSTVILATEVSVPVIVPSLGITKESDAVVVTNDQVITYTITVANTSTVSQLGIAVTDAVPAEVTYVPGTVQVTAPVETGSIFTNSVRDDFSSASYALNTGTANWTGNWVEEDETTSPSAGVVQIANGRLRLTNTNGASPGIYRVANIANPVSATLSLRYEASNNLEVIDSAHVEISTNNGATYIILRDYTFISGSETGIDSFDITPYASANTRVRVKIHEGYTGVDEFFRVDWLQIQYTTGTSVRVTNTFAGTAPPVLHTNQTLLPGESMTITFQAVADSDLSGITQIVNRACTFADGFSASLCDSVTDPVLLPAGLNLVKTVSKGEPGPYPGSDLELGTNGTPVTYWFVVSNTGEVALSNTTISDPDLGLVTNLGTLAIGQSITSSFDSLILGDLTNIAEATGTYLGETYTNSDAAVVLEITPSINLTKLVDGVNEVTGTNNQPVVYSFVVLNDGDVTLTNVTLIDTDITPSFTNLIGDLAAGASVTVEVNSVISGDLTNTATVTGIDPIGNTQQDSDDAVVLLIDPSITLTKLVDGVNEVTGTNNQPVVYSFVV